MFKCVIFKLSIISALLIQTICHSIDYIADDSEIKGKIKDESEKYTHYLIRDNNPEGYICLTDQCLRKCCPLGEGIHENDVCEKLDERRNDTFNAYIEKYNVSSFHVMSSRFSCNESIHFLVDPELNSSSVPYTVEFGEDDAFTVEYCIDYFENVSGIGAFVCHSSDIKKSFSRFFSAGKYFNVIISLYLSKFIGIILEILTRSLTVWFPDLLPQLKLNLLNPFLRY